MTTTDRAADPAALRGVIADVETGLNTNDAEPMVRHFAEDAVAVGVDGRETVLAREQGRWWIVARQNTLVPN